MSSLDETTLIAFAAFAQWRADNGAEQRGSYYLDSFGEVWDPWSVRAHRLQIERYGIRSHLGRLRHAIQGKNGRGTFHRVDATPGTRAPGGLVILPRGRRGIVVLDGRHSCVWKVVRSSTGGVGAEAEALQALADMQLEHIAPRMLGYGDLDDGSFQYVQLQLLNRAKQIYGQDRKRVLETDIMNILADLYARSALEPISKLEYVQDLERQYLDINCDKKLSKLFAVCKTLMTSAPEKWVTRSRIHGDVGMTNGMVVKDRIILIDWGLSDVGNVFRELFRQEHRNFAITQEFWHALGSQSNVPREFARGWWPTFIDRINNVFGRRYTDADLPFQMVASLIERVIFELESKQTSSWESVEGGTRRLVNLIEQDHKWKLV